MDLEERLRSIDKSIGVINLELGKLIGAQRTTYLLIKFVILPLILIVGGLVGLKLW